MVLQRGNFSDQIESWSKEVAFRNLQPNGDWAQFKAVMAPIAVCADLLAASEAHHNKLAWCVAIIRWAAALLTIYSLWMTRTNMLYKNNFLSSLGQWVLCPINN